MCFAAVVAAGCVSRSRNEMRVIPQGKIELERANFATVSVHAVGRACCSYVFWIPLSGSSAIESTAWGAMKEQAGLEGKAAQYVNVTVERSDRWSFYPFYWQEHTTVSADAIAFTDSERQEGGPSYAR